MNTNASPFSGGSSSQSGAVGAVVSMSLPKVLHYLQSEWRKFEMERDSWCIERAEFQSRVIVLEGERRGLENVKADLLKRIKMLEYGLRQERLKCLQLSGSSSSSSMDDSSRLSSSFTVFNDENSDALLSISVRDRLGTRARQDSIRSRDILKAYLNEVSLLCSTTNQPDIPPPISHAEHENTNPGAVTKSTSSSSLASAMNLVHASHPSSHSASSSTSLQGMNTVLSSTPMERTILLKSDFQAPDVRKRRDLVNNHTPAPQHPKDQTQLTATWKMKHALRHHLDAVRMVDVHASHNILASASMDRTIKLWHLGQKKRDIDPYLTLRAHHAPVLSVAFDVPHNSLFSGGADASLYSWKLSKNYTVFSPADRNLFQGSYEGHTDAIWDLKVHPLHSLLASCSSDTTVRLWDTEQGGAITSKQLIQTSGLPTSVSFVPSDHNRLLVSLTQGKVLLVDVETAQVVSSFGALGTSSVNRVGVHPTMPLAIAVSEDGSVQFIDWSSSVAVHRIQNAHSAAATSVDVSPGGLVVATGGHDCALRLWDIGMRTCVHETSGHANRRTEGIWSVCFGSAQQPAETNSPTSAAALASAGSDGVIKVYYG